MLAPEQVVKFPRTVSLTELARPCMSSFFRDAHWGQCLELLSHLCQHGTQTLVVIGPTDIGKTSMKYALENRQIANLHIIDDAHHLSLDQVARLLHEQEQRVVLFARPELLDRIRLSALHDNFQKNARIIEIEPLTIAEMEKFLQHQWQVLGHSGVLPCSKAELQKIYNLSAGIPGKVKQLFTDSLRGHNVLNTNDDAKAFSPIWVGVIVASGIVACLLALMWPSSNKQLATNTNISALPEQSPQQSMVAQIPVEPAVEFDQLYDPQAESDEVKLAKLEEKLVALQQQLDLEAQVEPVASTTSSGPTTASIAKITPVVTPQEPKAVTAAVSQAAVPKPVTPKPAIQGTSAEHKILAINNKHYALQLVAASNEQRVRDFITRNKLSGKAHYYSGQRNGKPWYTVVYGDFPNKTAALADLGTLPAEIKKLGPWVRQYSSIQSAIKNNLDHE